MSYKLDMILKKDNGNFTNYQRLDIHKETDLKRNTRRENVS